MLSEVISEVAWLVKLSFASWVITFEHQLISIGTRVTNFNNFEPIFWSIFESLPFTLIRLHFFTFNLFYTFIWIFAIISFTFSIRFWSCCFRNDAFTFFKYLFRNPSIILSILRYGLRLFWNNLSYIFITSLHDFFKVFSRPQNTFLVFTDGNRVLLLQILDLA